MTTETDAALAAGRLERTGRTIAELDAGAATQSGRCRSSECRRARRLVVWRRRAGLLLRDARCPLHPDTSVGQCPGLTNATHLLVTDTWARELAAGTRTKRNTEAAERKAERDAKVAAGTHVRVADLEPGMVLKAQRWPATDPEPVRFLEVVQHHPGGRRYLATMRSVAALEAQAADGVTISAPWEPAHYLSAQGPMLELTVTGEGLAEVWPADVAGTAWADTAGWPFVRVLELVAGQRAKAARARLEHPGAWYVPGSRDWTQAQWADHGAMLEAQAAEAERVAGELSAAYSAELKWAQAGYVADLELATLEALVAAGAGKELTGRDDSFARLVRAELERRLAADEAVLGCTIPVEPEQLAHTPADALEARRALLDAIGDERTVDEEGELDVIAHELAERAG